MTQTSQGQGTGPGEGRITAEDFSSRLIDLCLKSGLTGLPRKARDRHILLKSVVLTLNADRRYTEDNIDDRLQFWLTDIARSIDLDRVSLHRWLVDEHYLEREKDGSAYWVAPSGPSHELFEPEIDAIDVYETIGAGLKTIRQRKLGQSR